MNHAFCKNELTKVFGNDSCNTFIKCYAYIKLEDGIVAKATLNTAALDIDIITHHAGTIDSMRIVYADVFKARTGEGYHGPRTLPAEIKADDVNPVWKFGEPTDEDYAALRNTVNSYLNIFRLG